MQKRKDGDILGNIATKATNKKKRSKKMTNKRAIQILIDHGYKAVEELSGNIFVSYHNFDFCTVISFFNGGACFQLENGDIDIYYDDEDCTALYAWLGY